MKLDNPHVLRQPPDFCLPRNERRDRRAEDLTFELCRLVVVRSGVSSRALIARTSTNYHGDYVLEVMAEEHLQTRYGLQDGERLDIEVWTGPRAAAEAEEGTAA